MEVWKNIKGFENYQISSFGNIKSLKRIKLNKGKYPFIINEKILKKSIDVYGYYHVRLSNNYHVKTYKIHQLVAIAFLNHTPCGYKLVVNHKNFIKTDNRVENLEIITVRKNTNKKHLKSKSQYTGVSWSKSNKKWQSQIFINGKNIHLGFYNNEIDASISYNNKLNETK